jgi:hypothetical protein
MNTINTNMRIVLKLIVISQLVLLVLCIPVSGQNVKADFAMENSPSLVTSLKMLRTFFGK